MRPSRKLHSVSLSVTLALAAYPFVASAAVGDASGDRVLGQPNATSNSPNSPTLSASSLGHPYDVAFDAAGNLYVADYSNHRVLGYRSPMTTDRVADIVIGQPDFNSNAENNGGISASSLKIPLGLTVSPTGDLYVADTYNNRVLQYERPFVTDTVADRVFGQPDFASSDVNNGGLNAGTLFAPTGVAVDTAGNLWVADFGNNRVLEYDNPVVTLDRLADRVLGQPSFTENTANNGGVGARSLFAPFSVAVDAQRNVWVADYVNNRVLEYDDPMAFDATADRVLGQPSFMSNAENYTGQISAAGLRTPTRARVDANGNVYVCDISNNRVLMYTSPTVTNDRIADRVFGQPDLNSDAINNGGVTAQSLNAPAGVAFDPFGNVAIADLNNSRVVVLEAPTPIVTSIAVKVSSANGKAKLLVSGFGMLAGSAVVEVEGTPLATTKYKDLAAGGSARRLIALDPNFDTLVPEGIEVRVTVFNPLTGSRSAPIPFTR